jgi:hypothetical protein
VSYLVHINTHMTLIIHTFPVAYEQYLRRFVMDHERVGDFIGYRPEAYQVEVIKVDGIGWLVSFEPAFNEGTG